MSFTLHLSSFTRKQLYRRLQQAYVSGALRVVRRIQALLALADNQSVQEVAEMLNLGQQTIRDYRNTLLLKSVSSLMYTRPSSPAGASFRSTNPPSPVGALCMGRMRREERNAAGKSVATAVARPCRASLVSTFTERFSPRCQSPPAVCGVQAYICHKARAALCVSCWSIVDFDTLARHLRYRQQAGAEEADQDESDQEELLQQQV